MADTNAQATGSAGLMGQVKSHVLIRALLITAGTVSLALGIIGIVVPLLPTTPFLLLAAACYASGSVTLSRWLLTNRWFGSYLRNYREGRGMTIKAKAVSLLSLWAALAWSAFSVVPGLAGKLALLVVGVCVTAHLVTRPTCRPG